MEKFAALNTAKTGGVLSELDYFGNSNPRCPHCGEECSVSANEWWQLHEEGDHTVECPHCDGEFSVATRVSYSFSTDRQESGE